MNTPNAIRGPWLAALLVGFTAVAGVSAALADMEWREVRTTKDGIVLSRKPGRTSGLYVLRLQTRSAVAPDRLLASLWQSLDEARPPVRNRRFLSRTTDELVFYDQVNAPVVSDRDYTMRARRITEGPSRRLLFRTAPEVGPPPDPDLVRLPLVEGSWELWPDGEGSEIIYTVYSEPGGSVPAFLVRGAQIDQALADVRETLQEATVR